MNKQDRALQVAMFENCVADDAVKILNGFSFETREDVRTVKEITKKIKSMQTILCHVVKSE